MNSVADEASSMRLWAPDGARLYLNQQERERFRRCSVELARSQRTFAMSLFYTGCRISEALELRSDRILTEEKSIVFRSLKKRRRDVYRIVPAPEELIDMIDLVHDIRATRSSQPLWSWDRSTAWRVIKKAMAAANITGSMATAKGLRHGFGMAAASADIPLHLIQRWLGHSSINTTIIYVNAVGREERSFAERLWYHDRGRSVPTATSEIC